MAGRRHVFLMVFLVWPALFLAIFLRIASVSHAEIVRDGSLGSNITPITGPNYTVLPDHGRQVGGNLFHSFSTFNIGTGEAAVFLSPGDVTNIISRVTGGSRSVIDGAIRSYLMDGNSYSSANLYLLNPSGVMFGPNASLDIGGSFHVSTADYLSFGDGNRFFVNPSTSSVLTTADPSAFGFLSANPAPISLDRTSLMVPPGQTLSIIGGDIDAVGDPNSFTFYWAPGGRINIISVASPGEVNLNAPDFGIGSFSKLGNIRFTEGANLYLEGFDNTSDAAGTVVIRGGQMLFSNSGIYASGNPGGTVDIGGGALHLDSSFFYADTYGTADHPGSSFHLALTGDLRMTGGATLDSSTYGPARAGNIVIDTAGTVSLGDDVAGTGPLADYGYYGSIASGANGYGRGGDISIAAANLVVQNGFFVNTATRDVGNAGNLTVRAGTLQCLDQGNIGSNALSSGKGGNVDVVAREIYISGINASAVSNSAQPTGIVAQADGAADGSTLKVTADTLHLVGGGKIDTILLGSGHGADIDVTAKTLNITGYAMLGDTPRISSIDARVYGSSATGTGGNIAVTADRLVLGNGGTIRTALFADASGNSGTITVNAGEIELRNRGQIYADSFRGTGDSGNLHINATTLQIYGVGSSPESSPLVDNFTGLSTTTNGGRGGAVVVNLAGDLVASAGGGIKADTQGTGTGGSIDVSARNIYLSDHGKINAASTGTGNAGNITLAAADTIQLRDASITTEASVDADGGNITLTAPNMLRLVNSRITSSVGGGPQTTGGNIFVDPEFVILQNSQVVANAFEGTGGNILIVAKTFLTDPSSVVDASSALGVSGTVTIDAPTNNVSGVVTPLSSEFVSASALLRERCIARIREGKYSSFVVGGRDGLPLEPGNLLPAFSRF